MSQIKAAFFLTASLLLGAGNALDAQKEQAQFTGKWTVRKLTFDGDDHSALVVNFTFKQDEAVMEGEESVKGEYARLKFKLDPTARPKRIDFTVSAGLQLGTTVEGIYTFSRDEVRICARVFGAGRPSEFHAPQGSNMVLMVLQRAK